MATEKTLAMFFENCDETYCSVREFFSRFENNPASNVDCSGCDYTAKSCPASSYLFQEDDKMLFQWKMMEKFKYAEENREKKKLGWDEIGIRWFSNGYAQRFRILYNSKKPFTFNDIFLSN